MAILKYINIKAPKTLNDLRINHLKALTDEKYQKAMDLGTIIEFICLITGAKRSDLNKVISRSLETFTNTVLDCLKTSS
jgi:uncharacterized protein